MKLQNTELEPAGQGAIGTLRLGAIVLIFALATLGILVVLGALPAELLAEYAGRLAMVAGIVVLAGGAAALVLRLGRRS